jgi:hypothetical protein
MVATSEVALAVFMRGFRAARYCPARGATLHAVADETKHLLKDIVEIYQGISDKFVRLATPLSGNTRRSCMPFARRPRGLKLNSGGLTARKTFSNIHADAPVRRRNDRDVRGDGSAQPGTGS